MVTQPSRRTAAIVCIAALALIGVMTLRPVSSITMTPTFCIFCGAQGGVDFTLNILLFVPLGLGLRWLLGRWAVSVIVGAVTTLIVETVQWRLVPGRDASLGDLLANTLGSMLGAWIAIAGIRWLNATNPAARRYAGSFGILATVIVCASALLLQPVRPTYPQWVQWTPRRPNTDPFQGRLVAVEVNHKFVRPAEVLVPTRQLHQRSLSIRATIGGPAPPGRRQAIIVRIASDQQEGFSLVQRGEAAAFRTHIAADRLKLRSVFVGLEGALASPKSETAGTTGEFVLEANSDPRALSVSRQQPGGRTSVTLRRTAGLAWTLLMPWDVAIGPEWWWANACWLAILLLPVTFFTIRSGGRAVGRSDVRIAWWPLPLVLAALAASPATGLGALGTADWLGVLAGIGVGVMLERWTAAPSSSALKAYAPHGTILP